MSRRKNKNKNKNQTPDKTVKEKAGEFVESMTSKVRPAKVGETAEAAKFSFRNLIQTDASQLDNLLDDALSSLEKSAKAKDLPALRTKIKSFAEALYNPKKPMAFGRAALDDLSQIAVKAVEQGHTGAKLGTFLSAGLEEIHDVPTSATAKRLFSRVGQITGEIGTVTKPGFLARTAASLAKGGTLRKVGAAALPVLAYEVGSRLWQGRPNKDRLEQMAGEPNEPVTQSTGLAQLMMDMVEANPAFMDLFIGSPDAAIESLRAMQTSELPPPVQARAPSGAIGPSRSIRPMKPVPMGR